MAQLSIALAILVAALVCVYAIERIWFHQRSARAASIALWASNEMGAGLVFLVAIALLMLLVPVSCVHLVQKMIFGRRKAETMQPAVFLQKVGSALSTFFLAR